MKYSINYKNMDLNVKPGEDFDKFCNGNWKKKIKYQMIILDGVLLKN